MFGMRALLLLPSVIVSSGFASFHIKRKRQTQERKSAGNYKKSAGIKKKRNIMYGAQSLFNYLED
jgi:hypothetical protein